MEIPVNLVVMAESLFLLQICIDKMSLCKIYFKVT